MHKISILIVVSVISLSCSFSTKKQEKTTKNNIATITILHTSDIHGQLFPHDELFWENEQITFKKLGGLAHMKTLFEKEKSKNPEGTIILDGGNLFKEVLLRPYLREPHLVL